MSGRARRHEAARRGSPLQIGFALVALAMGGFAIGTTEFVSMGLLPQLASGVGVSIPTAGHVISAYAVGVVVGAPLIAVFGARLPRRELLIGLMAVFLVGNAASALATDFTTLTLARFFAGVPHGAYFGVASLVAADLVTPERRGRAVSRVMLGLAVSNVAGVPAATWLGQQAGWRSAYWLVTVPRRPDRDPRALAGAARRGQPRCHRPQRAARVQGPAGAADPARRGDRLRRHVRDVHLHRPHGHRRRRTVRGPGAALPARVRDRHGARYAARRAARGLVDLPLAAGLLGRDGTDARRCSPGPRSSSWPAC